MKLLVYIISLNSSLKIKKYLFILYFLKIVDFGLVSCVLFTRYQMMLDCWQENSDSRSTFSC